MTDIFKYIDYRKYLSDYFTGQKAKNRFFSYRFFSDKIGYKSKDFIFRVIHRRKDISRSSVFKISSALGHSPEEGRYFENLVCFNQAKTVREREFYFNQLRSSENHGKTDHPAVRLSQSQLSLFSQWHHPAIRALLDMGTFRDDYAWLAKQVYPPITPKKAKAAIRHLEKIGLIRKDESGAFRVTDKALTTDNETSSIALANFYLDCTRLTAHALEDLPKDRRNISGVTLGISLKSYEEIVNRINAFREEIAEIANRDNEADRVYQLQLALFPMSDPHRTGRKS